jgi:hypothetical protein
MLAGEDMSNYVSPNAITDVPEAYKQYVREHIDEIVSADLRGKLAWHFRDNRKYWENIELSKLVDKASIAEDQHIERNRAEYERYKNDSNYKDVEFNEDNGGLRATHIKHTFDKKKGWYEEEAQRIGFNEGHSVILGKEDHTKYKVKNNEGFWDEMAMETAGAETCSSANIRNALKHCAKKPDVQVAVIFLPEEYNLDEIHKGIARYNGLRRTSQWKEFEKIVFIHNGKIM